MARRQEGKKANAKWQNSKMARRKMVKVFSFYNSEGIFKYIIL